jgi:hypothetical protein
VCYSSFVKSNGSTTTGYIQAFYTNTGTTYQAAVNFATGVVTMSAGAGSIGGAIHIGNGVYRLWLVTPPATGTTTQTINIGTEGSYYWGQQVENNVYYPSSYIPTYGSSVTRAADVSSSAATTRTVDNAIITTYAFGAGTYMVDGIKQSLGSELLGVGTDVFGNSWRFATSIEAVRGFTTGSSEAVTLNWTAYVGRAKVAAYLATNNSYGAANGLSIGSDTSCLLPNITTVRLGNGYAGQNGGAHILKFSYWDNTPLTTAQLQAITK